MSTSIEAVKAELESARHALRVAEESHVADMRAVRDAEVKAARSYEVRAANARNVRRLEKALAILEEETGQ